MRWAMEWNGGDTLGKKMTIWDKTCFWRWKSRKSKKLRALLLFLLSKVATGDHFRDSKVKIWLKYPGFFLMAFFAAGPFVAFSEYMNFILNRLFKWFWDISTPEHSFYRHLMPDFWRFVISRPKYSYIRLDHSLSLSLKKEQLIHGNNICTWHFDTL